MPKWNFLWDWRNKELLQSYHIKGIYQKCRSKRKTGPNANSHCQLEQLNVWNNAFFKSTNLRRMEDEWESVDQMEWASGLKETILMNTGVDAVLCLLKLSWFHHLQRVEVKASGTTMSFHSVFRFTKFACIKHILNVMEVWNSRILEFCTYCVTFASRSHSSYIYGTARERGFLPKGTKSLSVTLHSHTYI